MWYGESSKPPKHFIESPVLVPLVEEIPGCGPGAELGREVTPRSASTKRPQDGIEDLSTVSWAPARLEVVGREQIRDQVPLGVGEAVARHAGRGHAPLGSRIPGPSQNLTVSRKPDIA